MREIDCEKSNIMSWVHDARVLGFIRPETIGTCAHEVNFHAAASGSETFFSSKKQAKTTLVTKKKALLITPPPNRKNVM